MPKHIVVADDHDVVRHGLRLILRDRSDWQIVAEAKNGDEAIDTVRSVQPDLMILDISMPGKDGIQVLTEMANLGMKVKVLVLTMHESNELIDIVTRLGAAGYVSKTSAGHDLVDAIQLIFDGGTYFPALKNEWA